MTDVSIEGRRLRLSNLDRVLYPETGFTKAEARVNAAPVRKAVDATVREAAPKPALSNVSIPASASGRTPIQDIRFRPRLAGPLEELRALSIVEWRRLSPNPTDAVLKIKGKLALLEEAGYEQRIAGIKAWKASPLSHQYLALSRESLASGKSLIQLAQAKAAAGELVQTAEELSAILALNAELRF